MTTTKTPRTDTHAPKNFDPADYRVIDYLDNKLPDMGGLFLQGQASGADSSKVAEMCAAVRAEHERRIFEHFPNYKTGGDDHTSIHVCNHCGHQGIRWVAVVEHVPTGKRLAFGEICAERCELSGQDAFKAKFIKTRAALEAAALANKLARAKFAAENSDVVGFLDGLEKSRADYSDAMEQWNENGCTGATPRAPRVHPFLSDMIHSLNRYGSLTEAQLAATKKFAAKAVEFAARDAAREAEQATELADAPAITAGRQEIAGKVMKTKWQDSDYNEGTLKMLVKTSDGNRYWGSVARSIDSVECVGGGTRALGSGDVVSFTATVTPSADDEHFGFFKRPTGATVLEVAAA